MACGAVTAEIHYLKKLPLYRKEKPFQLFIPVDKNAADPRCTNLEFEPKEQTFVDIRNCIHDFSLDSHGFQVERYPTALDLSSFTDRSAVESQYFTEVEQILKIIDGGYDKVFIFDWRVGHHHVCDSASLRKVADMRTLTAAEFFYSQRGNRVRHE
jgi:hypothetical protein